MKFWAGLYNVGIGLTGGRLSTDVGLQNFVQTFWLISCSLLLPLTEEHLTLLPLAQQPLVGQDLLTVEASRSHSVGILWTSDRSETETSTSQHKTLTRDRYSCPQWELNQRYHQASGRRPTP